MGIEHLSTPAPATHVVLARDWPERVEFTRWLVRHGHHIRWAESGDSTFDGKTRHEPAGYDRSIMLFDQFIEATNELSYRNYCERTEPGAVDQVSLQPHAKGEKPRLVNIDFISLLMPLQLCDMPQYATAITNTRRF